MCGSVYSRTGMRIEAEGAGADKKGSRIQRKSRDSKPTTYRTMVGFLKRLLFQIGRSHLSFLLWK